MIFNPNQFYIDVCEQSHKSRYEAAQSILRELASRADRFTQEAIAQILGLVGESAAKHGDHPLAVQVLTQALKIESTRDDVASLLAKEWALSHIESPNQSKPGRCSEACMTIGIKAAIRQLVADRKLREVCRLIESRELYGFLDADCLLTGAAVCKELGRLAQEQKLLHDAHALDPDNTGVMQALANLATDRGHYDAARETLHKLVRHDPDNALLISDYARTLMLLGRTEEAIAQLKKSISIRPTANALHNLGVIYNQSGDKANAERYLRKSLEYSDGNAATINTLINLTKPGSDSALAQRLWEVLDDPSQEPTQWTWACFGLATIYHREKNHPKAMSLWRKGNRIQRGNVRYDFDSDRRKFDIMRTAATSLSDLEPPTVGDGDRAPIFILGMPRSGTTLTETLVGSHDSVFATGELEIFTKTIGPIFRQPNATLSARDLEEIRSVYLGEATKIVPDGYRSFTDKMPLNFLALPFILKCFPDAKIVHTQRHPVDTCWSNYTHFFQGYANSFGNDLVDVARFYGEYSRFMDEVSQQHPGRIYHLPYERFVDAPATEGRLMFEYLGLDWDETILQNRTAGTVRTASHDQVRQPIYKGSGGQWKPYEQFIEPMIEQLRAEGLTF